MASMSALYWSVTCHGLTKTYHNRYGEVSPVGGIDLRLGPGTRIALVGPNGSGKSTLIRLLTGIELPTSGTLLYSGMESIEVAYVPQDYRVALLPWLTLRRNIELLAGSLPKAVALERFKDFCKRIAIELNCARFPYTFSGGEVQIAVLATALLRDPELLFFDEPLSAVDYARKRLTQSLIASYLEKRPEAALVVATHNFEEAVLWCDRVHVLAADVGTWKEEVEIGLPHPRTLECLETEQGRGYLDRLVRAVLV